MNTQKLKSLIASAVLAALCCVATIVIQIPSPANGYINLGDAVVLFCAFSLSPIYAAAAAGIGSALADVLTGYAFYAPATLIIKALMAFCACIIFKKLRAQHELSGLLTAGLASEAIMVVGYFAYSYLLLGNGLSAVASISSNLFQAVIGLAAGVAIYKILPSKVKCFS